MIDREADSIFHLRQWTKRGSVWLIRTKRAKGGNYVQWQGKRQKLSAVAAQLALSATGQVQHKGGDAMHWIASTHVRCPTEDGGCTRQARRAYRRLNARRTADRQPSR